MLERPTSDGRFATTEWSLVLAAGDSQAPDSSEALASLCRTYWYPVYAHVRHLGEPTDRAQDLTQGFFTHLLEEPRSQRCHAGQGAVSLLLEGGAAALPVA